MGLADITWAKISLYEDIACEETWNLFFSRLCSFDYRGNAIM